MLRPVIRIAGAVCAEGGVLKTPWVLVIQRVSSKIGIVRTKRKAG